MSGYPAGRTLWCHTEQRWTTEESACQGHDSTYGPIGSEVFCDGSCRPLDERDSPTCSRCGETYQCEQCGFEIDAALVCQRAIADPDDPTRCPSADGSVPAMSPAPKL